MIDLNLIYSLIENNNLDSPQFPFELPDEITDLITIEEDNPNYFQPNYSYTIPEKNYQNK
jgi:hypothetical protein